MASPWESMTASGCSRLSHGLGFYVQQTRMGHRERINEVFWGVVVVWKV